MDLELLVSDVLDVTAERVLPRIQLEHLHTVENLVHQLRNTQSPCTSSGLSGEARTRKKISEERRAKAKKRNTIWFNCK